jgi:hypothetical protein
VLLAETGHPERELVMVRAGFAVLEVEAKLFRPVI